MIDGSLASHLKPQRTTHTSNVALHPTSGVFSAGDRAQGFMHARRLLYPLNPNLSHTLAVLRSEAYVIWESNKWHPNTFFKDSVSRGSSQLSVHFIQPQRN